VGAVVAKLISMPARERGPLRPTVAIICAVAARRLGEQPIALFAHAWRPARTALKCMLPLLRRASDHLPGRCEHFSHARGSISENTFMHA
jgi:hypothetical protein